MPVKTFIKVNQNNVIEEVVRTNQVSPGPGYIEVSNTAEAEQIAANPRRFKWNDGLVPKPQGFLFADKTVINADGVDVATVTVSGVPTIQVLVGSGIMTLSSDSPLEVTSSIEKVVSIVPRDPEVYSEDVITIVALSN